MCKMRSQTPARFNSWNKCFGTKFIMKTSLTSFCGQLRLNIFSKPHFPLLSSLNSNSILSYIFQITKHPSFIYCPISQQLNFVFSFSFYQHLHYFYIFLAWTNAKTFPVEKNFATETTCRNIGNIGYLSSALVQEATRQALCTVYQRRIFGG